MGIANFKQNRQVIAPGIYDDPIKDQERLSFYFADSSYLVRFALSLNPKSMVS